MINSDSLTYGPFITSESFTIVWDYDEANYVSLLAAIECFSDLTKKIASLGW